MERFPKRGGVARIQKKKSSKKERGEHKEENIAVSWRCVRIRDDRKAESQKGKEREREKKRRREVVGGNGPYMEAGTTLASAILSAEDTNTTTLSHSHVAHVLLFLVVVPFLTSLYEEKFGFHSEPKKERR